jgi:hypothetical protein
MTRVRRVAHLARRWWIALTKGGPSPADEAWAESHLLAGEQRLWRQMDDADRRHAVMVARSFVARAARQHLSVERGHLAAALLHDVGKITSGLGTSMRVVATLVGPRTQRFRRYHDHERIGDDLLARAGSDPLTRATLSTPSALHDLLRAADDSVR